MKSSKKPSRTKKPKKAKLGTKLVGIATNIASAQAKTGLPMDVVQSARAAGIAAFQSNGRINCDALLAWAAETKQKTKSSDAEPNYFLERALDIKANRELKEQRLAEKKKLSWPVEKVRTSWTRNVIAAKTKLATAENAIAVESGMRLGFTTEQINALKEICARHIRLALKELNAGEWGEVLCPNCKTKIEEHP